MWNERLRERDLELETKASVASRMRNSDHFPAPELDKSLPRDQNYLIQEESKAGGHLSMSLPKADRKNNHSVAIDYIEQHEYSQHNLDFHSIIKKLRLSDGLNETEDI